jgi:hypothetical protein
MLRAVGVDDEGPPEQHNREMQPKNTTVYAFSIFIIASVVFPNVMIL